MLGVVLELFVVKEKLLTSGEHELCAAIVALQYSVDEFHDRLPRTGTTVETGHDLESLPFPFPCLHVLEQQGPGPPKLSGKIAACLRTSED